MAGLSIQEAADKVIPFGPYRGLTLEQVSQLPGGEAYLNSLLTVRAVSTLLKRAIQVYLGVDILVSR
jgi:hypothetical protein